MRHNARATFFGEIIQMAKVVVFRVNPPAVQPASFSNRPVPRPSSTPGFRQHNEYLRRAWRLKPFIAMRSGAFEGLRQAWELPFLRVTDVPAAASKVLSP
jgi:hypothetical protein